MKKFFCRKSVPLAAVLLILLIGGVFVARETFRHFVVYPGSMAILGTFGDRDRGFGGLSDVNFLDGGESLSIRWTLHLSEYPYPYAGVSFRPVRDDFWNLKSFKRLKIRFSKPLRRSVQVNLTTLSPETEISWPAPGQHRRILSYLLPPATRELSIPLDSFQTPLWWFQNVHENPAGAESADFGRVSEIALQSGPFSEMDSTESFSVEYIGFTGDVVPLLIFLGSLLAAGALSVFLVLFIRKKRTGPVVFAYTPVNLGNIGDAESEKVVEYIGAHFAEASLSMEKMAAETGMSAKKITETLRKLSGQGFKQYLNLMRINEAKRLLRETDQPVTTIGLTVGYSSPSYFSRVFLKQENTGPSEYRESCAANPSPDFQKGDDSLSKKQ